MECGSGQSMVVMITVAFLHVDLPKALLAIIKVPKSHTASQSRTSRPPTPGDWSSSIQIESSVTVRRLDRYASTSTRT